VLFREGSLLDCCTLVDAGFSDTMSCESLCQTKTRGKTYAMRP
jgi:hypothetical protein